MKYTNTELWHRIQLLKTYPWIKHRQVGPVRLSYADHNGKYLRGDLTLRQALDLLPYEDKLDFFQISSQVDSNGLVSKTHRFQSKTFSCQYFVTHYEINQSTQIIVKHFTSGFCKEQLIVNSAEGKQAHIAIFILLGSNQLEATLVKFLQESVINYSSLDWPEFFDSTLHEEEGLSFQMDKHFCNPNDSHEWQCNESDPKYIEEHYRLTQLDSEDLVIYAQLQERVRDYKLSSNTLIRFLIARGFQFDVDAAHDAIKKWIEWRQANRINRLSARDFPEFSLLKVVGESKCGRQVVYTKQSEFRPDKVDHNRYESYFIGFLEDVCRACKGYVDSYITIVDVEGFGYSNFDLTLTKSLLQKVLQYYPERQNKVFIINMSAFVMGFYKLLKPFLPTRTNEKLIFHGKDREEIKRSMIEHLGFSVY